MPPSSASTLVIATRSHFSDASEAAILETFGQNFPSLTALEARGIYEGRSTPTLMTQIVASQDFRTNEIFAEAAKFLVRRVMSRRDIAEYLVEVERLGDWLGVRSNPAEAGLFQPGQRAYPRPSAAPLRIDRPGNAPQPGRLTHRHHQHRAAARRQGDPALRQQQRLVAENLGAPARQRRHLAHSGRDGVEIG